MVTRDGDSVIDTKLEKLEDDAYDRLGETIDAFNKVINHLDTNMNIRQRGKALRAISMLKAINFNRNIL